MENSLALALNSKLKKKEQAISGLLFFMAEKLDSV